MAIAARLFRDGGEIGDLVAMRINPVDEPGTEPGPDDQCVYTWSLVLDGAERTSNELGTVEHRHGDGPWALIRRVLQQADL